MKYYFHRALGQFMGLISTLFIISVLNAVQAVPFYWEFINVEIELQENGDMLITETQKYVFTGPHTNERYRWIPLDKLKKIADISVFEHNIPLAVHTEIKNNQLWIKWRHTLNPPESHTFILKYRVIGRLHVHVDDPVALIYWQAIFKNRQAPIKSSKVTVHLPNSLAGQDQNFKSFGVRAEARRINAQTIEFIPWGEILPGKGLMVNITFPHGIFHVPQYHRQKSSSSSEEIVFWIAISLILSALLYSIVLFLYSIVLFILDTICGVLYFFNKKVYFNKRVFFFCTHVSKKIYRHSSSSYSGGGDGYGSNGGSDGGGGGNGGGGGGNGGGGGGNGGG